MVAPLLALLERLYLGRWGRLALLAACLAVGGCSHCNLCNLRGDGFTDDEFHQIPRKMRTVDPDTPSSALTNKGRDIERNLGCHE